MRKCMFVVTVLLALTTLAPAALDTPSLNDATAIWNMTAPEGATAWVTYPVPSDLGDATGNNNGVTQVSGASTGAIYWADATVGGPIPGDGWALYFAGSGATVKFNGLTGDGTIPSWSYIQDPPPSPSVRDLSGSFSVFMRINADTVIRSGADSWGNPRKTDLFDNWFWGNSTANKPKEGRGFIISLVDLDVDGLYSVNLTLSGEPGTQKNKQLNTGDAVEINLDTWYDILVSYNQNGVAAKVEVVPTAGGTVMSTILNFDAVGWTAWSPLGMVNGNSSLGGRDSADNFNGYIERIAVWDVVPEPATVCLLLGGALLGLRRRK